MRAIHLLVVVITIFLAPQVNCAADIKSVVSKAQELVMKKEYPAAQELLVQHLQTNKHSYQLWMALGYVFEASKKYEQALKAFIQASELQTGIDGLATKIISLQQLIKTQPKKKVEPSIPENTSLVLLNKAILMNSQGKKFEAAKLFIEGVELDRSLLAKDKGMIEKGLNYFSENPGHPEQEFFLGTFNFYSGQYSQAEKLLNNYIAGHQDGNNLILAKKLNEECKVIIAQVLTANASTTSAAEAKSGKTKPVKTTNKKTTPAMAAKKQATVEPEEIPDFGQPYVLSDNTSGEPLVLAMTRTKALKLLEEYGIESDEEKKLGLIWSIGLLQMPVPEVMTSFANFLESDNVDTIFATIEALEKINLPGAQVCLPQLYKLLGQDDLRVVYRAIKAFARVPMNAEQVIPKIFQVYKNENLDVRKQLIVNTVKAYGKESFAVLDAMIKQAPTPDKRPLAEILSVITGEDIETIINNS